MNKILLVPLALTIGSVSAGDLRLQCEGQVGTLAIAGNHREVAYKLIKRMMCAKSRAAREIVFLQAEFHFIYEGFFSKGTALTRFNNVVRGRVDYKASLLKLMIFIESLNDEDYKMLSNHKVDQEVGRLVYDLYMKKLHDRINTK